MCLSKDDHVIEAFAPDRTDQALDIRILPGRPGRDEHFGDLEPLHPTSEVSSVDGVAIAQEVPRRRVPREGLDNLPGRPFRGRVLGDVAVQQAPPVVGEDDEDEEDWPGSSGARGLGSPGGAWAFQSGRVDSSSASSI